MISAAGILRRTYGMFARVFPRCGVISQAIAFNLFLAFFPTLLIAVALATSRIGGKTSRLDLITDFTQFLPPVIQRVARAQEDSMLNVLAGGMVATLLWWLVDVLFGGYVRRVPYGVVYGGLAAVIGLIIWMQLSAVIIFLGAAWNAELAESRRGARARA